MELKRDLLSPGRYQYLSKEDSDLYDQVKDKDDTPSKQIKKLIIEKASASRDRHRASNY